MRSTGVATLARVLLAAALAAGCAASSARAPARVDGSSVHVAQLADGRGWESLRDAFRRSNPGHDIQLHRAAAGVDATDAARAVFVQTGEARARVGEHTSPLAQGDLVLLRPGEELELASALDLVTFTLPGALPPELPAFIRPDHDPRITDRPGGCATDTDAYRRILLTWLPEVGPYVYRSLNAHRVRIHDSFTHYHPVEGGFDELYLVQGAAPGARILTSDATAAIEARDVAREDVSSLFEETPLAEGDLVFLPRGTVHRGLDGVLAQVIAVPGFRPGTEIGVDEHLRAINAELGLEGAGALPVHLAPEAAPGR